jgi:hypothetical protein
VSVSRIYHCDAPSQNPDRPGYEPGEPCGGHVQTTTPPPYLPTGLIRVEWGAPNGNAEYHFCGWDCLTRYAAAQPLPEFYDPEDPASGLSR